MEENKNNWLPEIYQIGVRNPQGMSLSPFDGKIYITNACKPRNYEFKSGVPNSIIMKL